MVYLDTLGRLRLQRGAEHLHVLGARATAELLAEVGRRIGGMPCIIGLLTEYQQRVSPEMVCPLGGHKFTPRLRVVTR